MFPLDSTTTCHLLVSFTAVVWDCQAMSSLTQQWLFKPKLQSFPFVWTATTMLLICKNVAVAGKPFKCFKITSNFGRLLLFLHNTVFP